MRDRVANLLEIVNVEGINLAPIILHYRSSRQRTDRIVSEVVACGPSNIYVWLRIYLDCTPILERPRHIHELASYIPTIFSLSECHACCSSSPRSILSLDSNFIATNGGISNIINLFPLLSSALEFSTESKYQANPTHPRFSQRNLNCNYSTYLHSSHV